jgi:hypothetical protein
MSPWAKIDDRFHSHPKIRAALEHPYALGLHAVALSYCAAYTTDGVVHRQFIEGCISHPKRRSSAVSSLVAIGLWRVCPDGWEIHDWLEFNPSRAEIIEQRRQNAERQADWRDRRNDVTNALRNGLLTAPQPNPALKEEKKEERKEERRPPRRRIGGPTAAEANAAADSWAAVKAERLRHGPED